MPPQVLRPYWHDLCTPFCARTFLHGATDRPIEGSRPEAVMLPEWGPCRLVPRISAEVIGMRRGKEMVRLPVVDLSSGARVGMVNDLVIDLENRMVAALLLTEATGSTPAGLVPWDSIRRVGPDAVMIQDGSCLIRASERPHLQSLLESPVTVMGLEVLTEEGRKLGSVSDVVVDEFSGAIQEFEVSAGALRDAFAGRTYIPDAAVSALSQELMLVPESAVSGRRAIEGPAVVMEAPPWFAQAAALSDLERVAAQLVVRQEDLMVGTRARKTVANDDVGGVIVYHGETITLETIDKAKAAGKLNELVHAAGEAALTALATAPAEHYARIAVGRMAGATVHSTSGEVIVSQGDVVTPEVVQRAREAGVLDQLMEAMQGAEASPAERGVVRHRAAWALWQQVGERMAWLTGRR